MAGVEPQGHHGAAHRGDHRDALFLLPLVRRGPGARVGTPLPQEVVRHTAHSTQRARIARPRLAATLHLTPVLTLTSPSTSTLTFNLYPHLTLPSPHPTPRPDRPPHTSPYPHPCPHPHLPALPPHIPRPRASPPHTPAPHTPQGLPALRGHHLDQVEPRQQPQPRLPTQQARALGILPAPTCLPHLLCLLHLVCPATRPCPPSPSPPSPSPPSPMAAW